MIKFTICIPAYKAKFFKECIKSILNQDYPHFELIVLNDCSPQPIEEIVKSFDSSLINYVKNETNVGGLNLVNNWNKCLGMASNEYIMIMGDDDLLEPNYLSEFAGLIEKYPDLDVYHCRSKIIDDDGKYIMLTPSWPEFESVYDNIWLRLTERRAQYISDFVYRVSALKEKGGFYNIPYAWGSDDITAFMAIGNKGLAHTNNTVFKYRSNQISITSTGNYFVKMDANLQYEKWLREFLAASTPKNVDEEIVYDLLKRDLDKLILRKKVYVMTKSMVGKPLKFAYTWFTKRKLYNLSINHIAYSFINALRFK